MLTETCIHAHGHKQMRVHTHTSTDTRHTTYVATSFVTLMFISFTYGWMCSDVSVVSYRAYHVLHHMIKLNTSFLYYFLLFRVAN